MLWEFTNADLGFSYGQPAIVKTKKYGWVVMFASGYNNASGGAFLFIVNPRTGALLKKVTAVATATPAVQVGMAHIQPFLLDTTDGTADAVYAGDLLGNLWRFDLTATTDEYPDAIKIAQLTDTSGTALAVTSRPLVTIQPGSNKRWVTVGTGRLLAASDVVNNTIQSYFAIIDGTATRPNQAANLPAGVSFPIQRNKLASLTNLTTPISLDYNTQAGWVMNFSSTLGGGTGWRLIADSTSFYGTVTFATMLPSTAGSNAACKTSGQSTIYMIDLGTGKSVLANGAAYIQQDAVATDIAVISAPDPGVYIGLDNGTVIKQTPPGIPSIGYQRLNWREIPIKN